MELFQSDFFRISYQEKGRILKGHWLNCNTSDEYMRAIKEFKKFHDKIRPVNTLWDQRGFHYVINEEGQRWVDAFLNVPAMQSGNIKQVGIILSSEILPTISLLEIFKNGKAPVVPAFFSNENDALNALMNAPKNCVAASLSASPEWTVKELGDIGKARITVDVALSELPHYMRELSEIARRRKFFVQNKSRFDQLTRREKEILSLMLKGAESRYIADQLCISYDTIKTHRKRILHKLDCNKMAELMAFDVFL